MSDHNLLACISWTDERRHCDDPATYQPPAYCEHDGCPWTSTAATEQAQLEAYTAHHIRRHGEGL